MREYSSPNFEDFHFTTDGELDTFLTSVIAATEDRIKNYLNFNTLVYSPALENISLRMIQKELLVVVAAKSASITNIQSPETEIFSQNILTDEIKQELNAYRSEVMRDTQTQKTREFYTFV
ncbi:hypothetical protein LR066_01980 [candidate division WOR-3 bacterium]|nr:hypothetical protein [candidate division WOR-3 bacterium]